MTGGSMRNGSKLGSERVNLSLSYRLHMNSLLRRSDIAPPSRGNSFANWCLFLQTARHLGSHQRCGLGAGGGRGI
jgi:hypothetical protein